VISAQKRELFVVAFVAFVVLIVASSLMYYMENPAQPDSFPNIPAAMWWGVETLTTIGYGDVVPITPIGKLTGSLIALMGVALFAIPAGILSFGFYEEFHKHQEKDEPASQSRFQCTSIADEIKKAAELRDSDILTQLEFEDYKKQLLRSANVEYCGNLDNDRNN
jgi:voltage-gated potassium channel